MKKDDFNKVSKAEKVASAAGRVTGMLLGRAVRSIQEGLAAINQATQGNQAGFLLKSTNAIAAAVTRGLTMATTPMQVQPNVFKAMAEESGNAKAGRGLSHAFKTAHREAFQKEIKEPKTRFKTT